MARKTPALSTSRTDPHIDVSRIAVPLHPIDLILANLGVGRGLYETGALGGSLLLWLTKRLVLLGLAVSVGHSVTGSLLDSAEGRGWMSF
jgi:hypothetical protein